MDTRTECGSRPILHQVSRDRLCLADYFLPVEDVVAFQVVTMGSAATARTEETQARGDYSESYFSHGLSVSSADLGGLRSCSNTKLPVRPSC